MSKYMVIVIKMQYNIFKNQSYIILDIESKQAVIVDPAWDMEGYSNVIKEHKAIPCGVLLTHSHYDHTNLAELFADKYNIDVYISKIEKDFYNFRCNNLKVLTDEDTVSCGSILIKGILTPGHTLGGMCYYIGDNFFTGDSIFIEGCGACNFKGGSAVDMYHSIQKITQTMPLDTKIYPGHSYGKKPGYKLSYLMNNNIYFLLNDVNSFVDFRMRKQQTGLFNFK